MRNAFNTKHTPLAVACALALGVFSATVHAQAWNANETSLLVDSQGQPVMSGSGLCWHSGHGPASAWNAKCHDAVRVPVAAYVAPAPAPRPAPIVVAAAPLPVYEKVAFDANILFDSGKSDLRPLGRDKLDQFVADIQGLESRSVFAIGYADRMGSEADNQVLSRDRVETVKDYLVSMGIGMDRIQTSAKGETRPTTYPSECKDANNATNVACMQPDRHVFIEVSGTRLVQ
ncbi:MAG: OmpA family protein [Burkholderiales bacterium]